MSSFSLAQLRFHDTFLSHFSTGVAISFYSIPVYFIFFQNKKLLFPSIFIAISFHFYINFNNTIFIAVTSNARPVKSKIWTADFQKFA